MVAESVDPDIKIARMGFPFWLLTKRSRITSNNAKLLDTYAVKDKVNILEVVLECEARVKFLTC